MTEPRMRLRQKGAQFPEKELAGFLVAFGDEMDPLPETVRVLDEMVVDFIIETCHEAAAVAHHARRAKIKLDDFKFMLRRDNTKLGRVSEMLETDKDLKRKRKAFDTDEGAVVGNADVEGEGKEEKDKDKDKDKGKGKADTEKGAAEDEGGKKKRRKNKKKDGKEE